MSFKVVEKKNKNAVHCICETKERAERWIKVNAVEYLKKGYFTDKTLDENSFTIKEDDKKSTRKGK